MLSNLLIELIQKNKKIFFISFKTSIRVKIKSKIKIFYVHLYECLLKKSNTKKIIINISFYLS
jgi:hypothetical protein